MTPYGDDESRRRAKDLSVLEFITKPADFDLLKAQLRQLSEVACEPIDAQRGRMTAYSLCTDQSPGLCKGRLWGETVGKRVG